MTAQVSILLYTTRDGRGALAGMNYGVDDFISEAKSVLAETYKRISEQELDKDEIGVDAVLEKEGTPASIFMIVVVANCSGIRHRLLHLGHRTRDQLRGRFIHQGIDLSFIPWMQVEVVLADP